MGTLYTPLTGVPVADWHEKPDVPQSILTATTALERYANVPVVDSADRETKIPIGNRWVGMVTYNANTDSFEYWNGTSWQPVNRGLNMPASFGSSSTPDKNLNSGDYYDYLYTLNVTATCQVLLFVLASAVVSLTSTTHGGISVQTVHNTSISPVMAKVNEARPTASANGWLEATAFIRYALDPGTHKLGVRVAALAGMTAVANLYYVRVNGIRISAVANDAAGTNALGDW